MIDAVLIVLAYTLSFLFRFDFLIPPPFSEIFWKGLWIIVAIKPVVFLSMGFYRKLWRYASVTGRPYNFQGRRRHLPSVPHFFSRFFSYFDHFPRSIIILDWLILLFLVASSRLAWRLYRENNKAVNNTGGRRTLILGAGDAGSPPPDGNRKTENT